MDADQLLYMYIKRERGNERPCTKHALVCSTHGPVPAPMTGLGTGVLDLLPVGPAAAAAAALNAVGDEAATTHMHGEVSVHFVDQRARMAFDRPVS